MFTGKSQSNKLAFSFALLDQKRIKHLETLILSYFYKSSGTILDTKLKKTPIYNKVQIGTNGVK